MAVWMVRAIVGILNALPLRTRHWLIFGLLILIAVFKRRIWTTTLTNIRHVFPKLSQAEVRHFGIQSFHSLARFIVDSARFHTLDGAWVKEHVSCPFHQGYLDLKKKYPGKGILTASGHLGSIEIQALCAPFVGRRFSFVARELKQPKLNAWWKKKRELHGNEVIPRKGAVRKIISNLRAGIDVAVLIDQNVRREHALFVDWFGRDAATTFAFGHAAVVTEAPVVVSAISYTGGGKYTVNEAECLLQHIYSDDALSQKQKVLEVTKLISLRYQDLILKNPTEWFWMHGRWRTTPEGVPEDFYTRAK